MQPRPSEFARSRGITEVPTDVPTPHKMTEAEVRALIEKLLDEREAWQVSASRDGVLAVDVILAWLYGKFGGLETLRG